MRWIKNRNLFLKEDAKIRDLVLPRQAKEVTTKWGEEYLDFEEVIPTKKIKQGSWVLSEEDKNEVLSEFFGVRMKNVYETFKNLPDKFKEILKKSIDVNLVSNSKFTKTLENFNIDSPSVDEIYLLYENVFRKLTVSETNATEKLVRDSSGKPIMGEDGRPMKEAKEAGDPVFSNNLVNINAFITEFNRCYPDSNVNAYTFSSGDVYRIRNTAGEDMSGGEYTIDFEIFKNDLILQIEHKPSDILNISISKFFASCQHLYTGGYRDNVIGNVFDPNSIPAFLKFDVPIYWKGDKISNHLPISRTFIRSIEGLGDSDSVIFFDSTYPDRLYSVAQKMITKYSGNERTDRDIGSYLFTPDIPEGKSVSNPYMDTLNIKVGKYIGKNTKRLILSPSSNWSNCVISDDAIIKELIIETIDIPKNLPSVKLDLDWVIFKGLKINNVDNFNFTTKIYKFDKCILNSDILIQILEKNPGVDTLSFISSNLNDIDFSKFEKLESLELVYSLKSTDKLESIIDSLPNLKKLKISGDLLSNSSNKSYINKIKKSGIKIETVGLVI
jgi:hypothetical protein